jgi:hypothetical protein
MAESRIVLMVDGVLVRDDANTIAGIRERLQAVLGIIPLVQQRLEVLMSEISDALDGLQADLNTLFTEVEELLTQPNPDIAAALMTIGSMRTAVQGKVDEINQSQSGGTEPPPAPGA